MQSVKRSACALANTTRLPLPTKERPKIRSGVQRHAELRLLQKPLLRHRVAYGASRRGGGFAYLFDRTPSCAASTRVQRDRSPVAHGKIVHSGFLAALRAFCARDGEGLRAQQAQQGRLYRAHTRRPLICWRATARLDQGANLVTSFPASGRAPGTHASPTGDLRVQRLDTLLGHGWLGGSLSRSRRRRSGARSPRRSRARRRPDRAPAL